MDRKVLILGGYGNFGKKISVLLAKAGISIIIAGRNKEKLEKFQNTITSEYPKALISSALLNIDKDLSRKLLKLKPVIVINTCGPFQNADYLVAEICIKHRIHYIDLSDDRKFVKGIHALNAHAEKNNVLIVSGASTVPGLSSAVLEHYKDRFAKIESLIFGISPGDKTERGIATVESVLSYLGKPLEPYPVNTGKQCYGWQDIYRQQYPDIGKRWMANCNIPDLDLLPQHYGLQHIQFSAGTESNILHLGMWVISWLIRLGIPIRLTKYSKFLLRISNVFSVFGTTHGGMHMLIKGKDNNNNIKKVEWFIIAKEGDGPQIPCIPAVVITKKLLSGSIKEYGAMACIGLITLEEYMQELSGFAIKQYEFCSR
ncbi:hypothetical protein BIY23_01370 [Wolbachia pipientis]|uniref:Saccharopine dehydrogenase NADP binding domain-containing protein n=1 Tax=Wolbachia pipientis TaxID=955 RepID=A0A1E7QL98_WOLPI|nr:saccharopine dehydrogenase NADP-binding domain-containing protein [Wolbachia pipientis]OEY87116.1 hypothetical protein BIY23_01370 [Wolbachia pipientis]